MPTYEYECAACGHTVEIFQSITEAPIRKCPKCKKLRLRRLIGCGGGIIFKGTGFYETDYRSAEYKSKAKQEESGSSSISSDSKSESKSDAKSETKSESKTKAKNAKD